MFNSKLDKTITNLMLDVNNIHIINKNLCDTKQEPQKRSWGDEL